jgi:hypothetical protein
MKASRHLAPLVCLAWLASAVAATNPAPAGASVAPPAPSEPAAAPKADSTKTAAAKAPAAAVPLSPRFQQVRDRINALFSDRVETPPPPDLRYNPFRPIGAGPPIPVRGASTGRETPAPASAISDQALLQQAVALLKVGGVVRLKDGRMLRSISSGPNKEGTYKEGDVLTVIVQDEPIHIRVRQITAFSVMFSFNDAEITLKQ